ncbi:unnamed protein product [Urochloa humidicola]
MRSTLAPTPAPYAAAPTRSHAAAILSDALTSTTPPSAVPHPLPHRRRRRGQEGAGGIREEEERAADATVRTRLPTDGTDEAKKEPEEFGRSRRRRSGLPATSLNPGGLIRSRLWMWLRHCRIRWRGSTGVCGGGRLQRRASTTSEAGGIMTATCSPPVQTTNKGLRFLPHG